MINHDANAKDRNATMIFTRIIPILPGVRCAMVAGLFLLLLSDGIEGKIVCGRMPQEQVSGVADQSDQDAKKVMALMRLTNINVADRPRLKEAVLRHMERVVDEKRWLELADRFRLPETGQQLLQIAGQSPDAANSVAALQILWEMKQSRVVLDAIEATKRSATADDGQTPDPAALQDSEKLPSTETLRQFQSAARLAAHLGTLPQNDWREWAEAQLDSTDQYPQTVANALIRSIASSTEGCQMLLDRVKAKSLPGRVRLATASALSRSRDATIREQAARFLPLPQARDQPLPPVHELARKTGSPDKGATIFAGAGTCAKCHIVNGTGTSVGPDLSEIGSKLARDAMYTAILDPNAAISHNYENYAVQTIEGKLFTGLLVNETDDKVVLKSAEGVPTEILRDDIDEMQKLEVSLMPADLARPLTQQDLVDLVEYLTTLKKAE